MDLKEHCWPTVPLKGIQGDVTVFQNSQLIAKSKTRFLDRNVFSMSASFAASKRGKMEV